MSVLDATFQKTHLAPGITAYDNVMGDPQAFISKIENLVLSKDLIWTPGRIGDSKGSLDTRVEVSYREVDVIGLPAYDRTPSAGLHSTVKLTTHLFLNKDIKDPIFNVRAIILGGIAYIVFHNYLNSIDSTFKQYFRWIILLDILAMCVIYNSYYSESILKKINMILSSTQKRNDDRSNASKKSRVVKDTASYFNDISVDSDEPSIRQLEDIDEVDEDNLEDKESEDDKSVQNLIDQMIGSKKST